jgi:hypothetical protein
LLLPGSSDPVVYGATSKPPASEEAGYSKTRDTWPIVL